mgnify:CR=1 FL=1
MAVATVAPGQPGFWKFAAEAKATQDSVYFTPGKYVVRIENWKLFNTRNGRPTTALETTILSSDDHEGHPIGSKASWLVMLDQDMAGPNLKMAVRDILGVQEDGITEEIFGKIILSDVDPANKGLLSPLAGVIVDVTATNILTRDNNDFTKVVFKKRAKDEPVVQLAHRTRSKVAAAPADV